MIGLSCSLRAKWQIEHKMKYPTVSLFQQIGSITLQVFFQYGLSTVPLPCSAAPSQTSSACIKNACSLILLLSFTTQTCVYSFTRMELLWEFVFLTILNSTLRRKKCIIQYSLKQSALKLISLGSSLLLCQVSH